MDLLYLGLGLVFFGIAAWLITFLGTLGGTR
jgi:hypothetical protein